MSATTSPTRAKLFRMTRKHPATMVVVILLLVALYSCKFVVEGKPSASPNVKTNPALVQLQAKKF